MAVPPSTFVVDDPGAGVGSQANLNSATICDFSGFRIGKRDVGKETWNGLYVLAEFWEPKNAQQDLRGNRAELLEGSERPESGTDTFLSVGEVTPGNVS